MTDLKTLRQTLRDLAGNSIPGPWAWRKFGWVYCLVADYGSRKVVLDADTIGPGGTPVILTRSMAEDSYLTPLDPEQPNAKYIAAANPENILRLLDALETAEAALEKIGSYCPEGRISIVPQKAIQIASAEAREALSKLRGGR